MFERTLRARVVAAAAMIGAMAAAVGALAETGGPTCAEALPPACLQSFGAGSLAARASADGEDCVAKLDAYRTCIAGYVATRGAGDAAAPPLTRAERGFLQALEAELADNVGRLAAFVDALDLTGAEAVYENDWPALRLRFFNATDNPAYFAAPAEWLAQTQGFYDDIGAMLGREDVRRAFRRQTTSVLYERRLAKERFEALVTIGRDELLPAISAEIAAN